MEIKQKRLRYEEKEKIKKMKGKEKITWVRGKKGGRGQKKGKERRKGELRYGKSIYGLERKKEVEKRELEGKRKRDWREEKIYSISKAL
jgi:hypothetical protein